MLRDHLFENTGSFIAGCAVWVPIGIWVLGLIQWAIQGDIDFLSALAGICVGIGLGATALLSKEPYMAPLILVAVVITMLAFPAVRSSLNKRALAQIDVEAIDRAYEALSMRPGNAAAKFKLAKAVYGKGMPAHAIALAEDAIQQMPEAIFPEEHRILKNWRHYRVPAGQGDLSCLECNYMCTTGQTHCQRCGAPFLLEHAKGAWVGKGLARKFIAAWVSIVVAIVGIPYVAGAFPPMASIPVILGLCTMAIVVLVVTFRTSRVQS